MAYADFADVEARAGRISPALSVAGKHPDQADVEVFLATVTAELDAGIRARGYDPALLSDDVKEALRDLTAWGALRLALPGIDPSSRPDGVQELLTDARAIWTAGLAAISTGTLPAIAVLEAGAGGGGEGATAGSFQTEEPDYGRIPPTITELQSGVGDWNPSLAPAFRKGQSL